MTAMISDFAHGDMHNLSTAAEIGQNAIEKPAASDRRLQRRP